MNSIFIAELIGTMILVLLGNGVVANVVLNKTKGNGSGWIVITTGWAFAVFAGVLVAGPYSGAHLNPAVTLGLAMVHLTPWSAVPAYIAGQMVGGIIGQSFGWLMYKDHFDQTEGDMDKLACFCTAPAIRNVSLNFLSELLGTFILVFAVFYITNAEVLSDGALKGTTIGLGSVGALPVAIIVWVVGLCLGGTTGYAINPARDLAPRMVHAFLHTLGLIKGKSDWGYAWIPVIAPMVGAAIAAWLFMAL